MIDMQVNQLICVATKNCPKKRKFWIAKVEAILSRTEDNIPIKIQVLWYAVRENDDPFTEIYKPDVNFFEIWRNSLFLKCPRMFSVAWP